MTSSQSALDLGDELVVRHFGDFLGLNWLADDDDDRRRAWNSTPTRPGRESAVDADRQERTARSTGQRAESWLEIGDVAVERPRSLGKYQHHLATFKTTERFLEARQTKSIAVDGNCIERADAIGTARNQRATHGRDN